MTLGSRKFPRARTVASRFALCEARRAGGRDNSHAGGEWGIGNAKVSGREAWVDDTETMDLRGLKCPLPVLKAGRRLRARPRGARLVVMADDPMAAVDIPNFCREEGHRLLSTGRDGAVLRFEIEKV
jgi:tRNA 2-thiouridine synthesizing protein A